MEQASRWIPPGFFVAPGGVALSMVGPGADPETSRRLTCGVGPSAASTLIALPPIGLFAFSFRRTHGAAPGSVRLGSRIGSKAVVFRGLGERLAVGWVWVRGTWTHGLVRRERNGRWIGARSSAWVGPFP